jgi:hypothetical protein
MVTILANDMTLKRILWVGPADAPCTLLENLAKSILAANGIGAIWQLHLDAAHAYRIGFQRATNAILELAEATEGVRLKEAGTLLWSAVENATVPQP